MFPILTHLHSNHVLRALGSTSSSSWAVAKETNKPLLTNISIAMTTITIVLFIHSYEVVNYHSYTLVKFFFDLLVVDPVISHVHNLS